MMHSALDPQSFKATLGDRCYQAINREFLTYRLIDEAIPL